MNDVPANAWIIQTKDMADTILMNGGKIILMTEEIPDYLRSPQYGTSCLSATCLMPGYEAISFLLDNDLANFQMAYYNALMMPESTIYFATIISAVVNNIPLGFIFGTEDIEVQCMNQFLGFLLNTYGLQLGLEGQPNGIMHGAYIPNNICMLYQNNLLTPQEFLYVYPVDMEIDPNCLQKLIMELHPMVNHPDDIMEYIYYFNFVRKQLKEGNRVMADPMEAL